MSRLRDFILRYTTYIRSEYKYVYVEVDHKLLVSNDIGRHGEGPLSKTIFFCIPRNTYLKYLL